MYGSGLDYRETLRIKICSTTKEAARKVYESLIISELLLNEGKGATCSREGAFSLAYIAFVLSSRRI